MTFEQMGLSKGVLQALAELGFEQPTEIQSKAIPRLMTDERDFIGLAQTGTGKTAAFGIPMLERIDTHKKHTQALVLAPTRELGQQIAEQLSAFGKHLPKINILPVYGGTPIMRQIKALKNPQHIIIATPGRLRDLIRRKAVKLGKVQILALDEADEMLNMGFKEEIDDILQYTPDDTTTWLFSATMPKEIKRIVKEYMTAPYEVKINAQDKVNTNIEHQYIVVKHSNKTEALGRFLDMYANMRCVVFCRTRVDTQLLAEDLVKRNYKADALHGDLSQQQRDRVMKRFKAHDLQILIATDVAARGIDVDDLTHVVHFTLPEDRAYYTHRSGRTARAGKKGISLAFIGGKDNYKIKRIQNQLGIKFKKIEIPSVSDVADQKIENWCTDILEKRIKGRIAPPLLEKVTTMFADLTKEEILMKVLVTELEKLKLDSNKDLNAPEHDTQPFDKFRGPKSRNRSFSKRQRPKERRKFKPNKKKKRW